LHFVGVELDETWTAGSGVQEPQELADLFVAVHSGE
jgi:hypothetical protein